MLPAHRPPGTPLSCGCRTQLQPNPPISGNAKHVEATLVPEEAPSSLCCPPPPGSAQSLVRHPRAPHAAADMRGLKHHPERPRRVGRDCRHQSFPLPKRHQPSGTVKGHMHTREVPVKASAGSDPTSPRVPSTGDWRLLCLWEEEPAPHTRVPASHLAARAAEIFIGSKSYQRAAQAGASLSTPPHQWGNTRCGLSSPADAGWEDSG